MVGFRICTRTRKVEAGWVSRFADLPVANVSDVMARLQGGMASLRPCYSGTGMAGAALTVRTRPGDNLMVHKALDLADPGDVVVVDAGGDLSNAIIGELMVAHAVYRRLGGIVINGAIRDSTELRAGDFPVFAAGITHRGPYKDGPGEINVPIAIGSMVIEPGDLICGDGDGLVAVPIDKVQTVYEAASKKNKAEAQQLLAIESGTSDRDWVDKTLKQLGCRMER